MSEATGHHERPAGSSFHQNLDGAKVGKNPETAKRFREYIDDGVDILSILLNFV